MARYPVASDVRLEDSRPLTLRRTRSPQHTFNVRLRPWQLVPVAIAPVLAGETMKSALIQARVLSDPIISAVTGWWLEFYLFYVRVGDLEVADTVRAAASDPTQNMSALAQAAATYYYHQVATAPSWVYECLRVIVRSYFRQEGENWNDYMVENYPAVQMTGNTWLDSIHTDAALGNPSGADTWNTQWAAYQALRSSKLTTNTWGEWLAKYGVQVPPQMVETTQDYRIPELVRFVRDFAYPVPTVDPTTGLIASTVQWSMAERVDKRRFFAEPGFLLGLMCVRPKVYMANARTAAVDIVMASSDGFMQPDFETDPHATLVKIPGVGTGSGTGPVYGASVDHWMDRRDLFLYGDQFLNIDLSAPPTNAGAWNMVALPATNLTRVKYPQLTDASAMFVDTTVTGKQFVRSDGVCSLRIASRIGVDTTD